MNKTQKRILERLFKRSLEDLEDLKDICMTANALILVHRTNRKNPYYTKLWKTLRQNKNPIIKKD